MQEEFIGGGKINFDNQKVQQMRTVNSTILFLLSFITVDFFYNLGIFLTASIWGLTANLKYHSVTITEGLQDLKPDSKFIIFCSGLIFCLLIGTLATFIYHRIKRKANFYKIFFLWLGFNSFFAVITRLAFAESSQAIWFSKLMQLINANKNVYLSLQVIAVLLSIILALFFARLFIQTTNTKKYIQSRSKRKKYLSQVVVIPWLVGSVASYFFFFPNTDLIDGMHFITLAFPIIIMYFYSNNRSMAKTYIHRYPSDYKMNKTAIIVMILAYIEFHVFLVNGVHF